MRRKYHSLPPPGEPQCWVGRRETEAVVQRVAHQNYERRQSANHADFTYLIASGHVRSGKTRTGIETPRIVKDLCAQESKKSETPAFSDPVYLKIDFLSGAKFNAQFDVAGLPYSVALGARLISSFYQGVPLKIVEHETALKQSIPFSKIRADLISSSQS